MKRFYIFILIIFLMTLGYGCTVCKLPAFPDNTGNMGGCGSGRQAGGYSNPITTGIDFFIARNHAINLRLNLSGQDSGIHPQETRLCFDPGKIGPVIGFKYYF